MERPYVCTIAGHDPSGGAGLNADLKVFEQHMVYGFSVCTATTVQTDNEFFEINWVDAKIIKNQLLRLVKKFTIKFFKIGIIQSADLLKEVVEIIRFYYPDAKIIWDPILSASAGEAFHHSVADLRIVTSWLARWRSSGESSERLRIDSNLPSAAATLFFSRSIASKNQDFASSSP